MQDFLTLYVNGESRSLPRPGNIRELLEILQIRQDRIAVEVNRRIIKKAEWDRTCVNEGDRVEIVQFVGGG
jgi:thiamine biosynthesis protein ThiS